MRKHKILLVFVAFAFCLTLTSSGQAQRPPDGRAGDDCNGLADLEITPAPGWYTLMGEWETKIMAGEPFEFLAEVKNLANCHTPTEGFWVFLRYGSDTLASKLVPTSLGPGSSIQVSLTGTAPPDQIGTEPKLLVFSDFPDVNWDNNEYQDVTQFYYNEWHGPHIEPIWVDIKNNGEPGWPSEYFCNVIKFRNSGDLPSCGLYKYRVFAYERGFNRLTEVCGSPWRQLPGINPGETLDVWYTTCWGEIGTADVWKIEIESYYPEDPNCVAWPSNCPHRTCENDYVIPGDLVWGHVDYCN